MTFGSSILTLLLLLGFSQAVTVSGLLIYRSFRKRRGDFLLVLLFFLSLYIYMTDILISSEIYRVMLAFLLFTEFPFLFVIPPLLFMNIKRMTGDTGHGKKEKYAFFHFIPFLIIFAVQAPMIFESPANKIEMLRSGTIAPPLLGGVDMAYLGLGQYLIYLIYSLILVIRTVGKGGGLSLQIRKAGNILLFYLILFISLAASFYNLMHYKYYPQRGFSHNRLILDFPIFLICIYNYVVLMSGGFLPISEESCREKYRKSGLLPDENRIIYNRLCAVIKEEELWSEPDLSLRDLARQTGCSYHHLSQVINQTTGLNYPAFINNYRINHSCRLLESTDKNVLDIAFAAGFNSKTTFNKVFKREKGCTPSQYRANHRK